MRPRPYQADALAELEAGDWTGLVASQLGTGKTAIAPWAAQLAGSRRVLIVAPLRTEPGWARTVQEVTGAPLRLCVNSRGRGRARSEATRDLKAGVPGWYFVTWETLRQWGTTRRRDSKGRMVSKPGNPLPGVTMDHLVADEVHRACDFRSLNSGVLTRVHATRRLALSATPAGAQPVNVYGALKFLWPKRYPSYTRFADHFFVSTSNIYSDSGFGSLYGREKRPGAVRASTPVWIDIQAREVLDDLPEVTVVRVDAQMTAAQRRQYRGWEEQAVAWLDAHPVAIDLPVTKDMRLRQATLGELTLVRDDTGTEQVAYAEDCASGKIDALLDILAGVGDEPVIVYTHSQRFMAPLLHRLWEAGYTAIEVSGKSRDRWEDFRDGKVQVMCAVVEAVAEGVDGLQHRCHTEVWLSQSNSVVKNVQATGRLERSGQKHRITRYLVSCPGTVDTKAVAPRLADKYRTLAISGLI